MLLRRAAAAARRGREGPGDECGDGARLDAARERLDARRREPRNDAPRIAAVYELAELGDTPAGARAEAGHGDDAARRARPRARALQRGVGRRAARRCGRPARLDLGEHGGLRPGEGFWNAATNPAARTLSIGGICEDAMAGILSGLSSFGHHVGVGSSYGAFLAPLGHIAARLHAIGSQAEAAARPVEPDGARLRARGAQDRRGRPDARRPAAAAAAAGELPARHRDHADAVGSAGVLAAAGCRAAAPARAHRPVRDAAERDGARPREARPGPGRGRRQRRLPAARRPRAAAT